MNDKTDCYELGQAAFLAGKARDPMKDRECLKLLENKTSAAYHPKSLGIDLSPKQRQVLEEKILAWKRGWDDERAKV